MISRLVTIGAYGFSQEGFFQALKTANVDTFCDLRQRRGMRGSLYSFANSARLQERLKDFGIRYLYMKELAPPPEIRAVQKKEDRRRKEKKSQRVGLAPEFVVAYQNQVLFSKEPKIIKEWLGDEARVVALFCVEREPRACHRSLVASYLSTALSIPVEDILP